MNTTNQQLLGCIICAIGITILHTLLLWGCTGLMQTLSAGAISSMLILLYMGSLCGLLFIVYMNNRSNIKHPK